MKNINCYQENIDKFATDVLGFRLHNFQSTVLKEMGNSRRFMFEAERGYSKTFTVLMFAVCQCKLNPGIKIALAAHNLRSSNFSLQTRLKEMSEFVDFRLISNSDYTIAKFDNGSEIIATYKGRLMHGERDLSSFDTIIFDDSLFDEVELSIISGRVAAMTSDRTRVIFTTSNKFSKKFIDDERLNHCSLRKNGDNIELNLTKFQPDMSLFIMMSNEKQSNILYKTGGTYDYKNTSLAYIWEG